MRHPGHREDEGFYTYREFAHAIADYVKKMGYTHVELMGMAEHPYDGSWGYQVTGYYAPTSRYGTPEDFAYMIDYLHRNGDRRDPGLGTGAFSRGTRMGWRTLTERRHLNMQIREKGEHPDWGTKIFRLRKPEVQNFLIANALFWIEHYHVDGSACGRGGINAVSGLRQRDGQWVPNKSRRQ